MVENKLVNSIHQEFSNDFSLKGMSDSKSFEYLVAYSIISKFHPEAFDDSGNLSQIDVDSNGTFGLDSIAFVVNGNLCTDLASLDEYVKSKWLDVKIIFIQSKYSENFETGDFLKFTEAVKQFFDMKFEFKDERLAFYRDLYLEIFKPENSRYLNDESPSVYGYFVNAGKEIKERHLEGIIKSFEIDLKNKVGELKEVQINLRHADFLLEMYKDVENRFEVTINFRNSLSMDKIDGVDQSYIGYLPASEYLKLITDKNNQLRKNLFYENVRDFQGEGNPVNKEINQTLSDPDNYDQFILLNNGVTIVCGYMRPLGSNNYLIKNFQIVNGCQTSNILFINKEKAERSDKLLLPIKLVHTNDSEVIGKIIRATNRQTSIPDEAFIALLPFHKKLQDYFKVHSKEIGESLYYERRSKEYRLYQPQLSKSQLVNLHGLIRSMTSVFFLEPHRAYANNPNTIYSDLKDRFFKEEHELIPYYASSLIYHKISEIREDSPLYFFVSKLKYFHCMAANILVNAYFSTQPLTSKKIVQCSEKLIDAALDKPRLERILSASKEIIQAYVNANYGKFGNFYHRQGNRTSEFKDFLISECRKLI